MKRIPWAALALLLPLSPSPSSAQGLALAPRVGTLGLGGEVAFGLSDVFVLRGGFGFFPYEYDGAYGGEDYTVIFPKAMWTAGIDL